MRRGGELSLSDGWENGAGKAEGPVTIWVVLVCIWTCDPNPSFAFGATDPNDGDVFCLVQEMAETVTKDFGRIGIFVHSLANGLEVTKPLLETSRRGFLATISALSYSFVSLLRHFLPIMNPGEYLWFCTFSHDSEFRVLVLDVLVDWLKLCFLQMAMEVVVDCDGFVYLFELGFFVGISSMFLVHSVVFYFLYEGGMSSAKAALESDTKVLAFELHLLATKHQVII
ncbi:hypothetical protein ZIOFF_021446 [Zingiber officinale]|uniref:Uncharacterized protein n=1 Tax=Zingiber officinale TaxID=94328 RepID=A0A8J5LH10_ZINOF|nr:hypothetical protein ZIOFF_021446 [Zingiber officinale]